MKPIQVFEYEKLTIYEDEFGRQLTSNQLDKLWKFNDNNKNKYFTAIRNGVKFKQYVGVIQIGNLTIEILPKADKKGFEGENNTNVWRNVLLQMLSISGNIKLETVSEASLKKRNNTLLDLYFEKYVKEVEILLRKGLVKKYRNKSGNLLTLKGRLDFSKNIQQNLIHKERFYTNHQHYDYENLINQILIKSLRILTVVSGTLLKNKIKRLIFNFPEINEIEITKSSFDKISLNRKTEKYSEALKIAKMIILNYSPDISRGEENMIALMFNMNDLWEKYIYTMLKRSEKNYTVSYHNHENFWKNRYIEPDIVLKKDNETYIIDTKWKIVTTKPSLEDLKQMYVYNMYWNAPKSMLLYPLNEDKQDSPYGKFYKGRSSENKCKLGFVSVLNKEKNELNTHIGKDIVSKLNI